MELDWNGEQGRSWVDQQAEHDAALADFVPVLLDAAALAPGDAVLDIGCGCGATTRAAARAVAGSAGGRALGVDVSDPMLDRARELAAADGLSDIDFLQADAQSHDLGDQVYDAAISRFGVMFFDDPRAAFANILRAMRPGGRLAFVCWQPAKRNPHISLPIRSILAAFPGALPKNSPQPPFSMSDPDEVRTLLSDAGWSRVEFRGVEGPVRVGASPEAALAHFLDQPMAKSLLDGRDPEKVDRLRRELLDQLREWADENGAVSLASSAWLVTAVR